MKFAELECNKFIITGEEDVLFEIIDGRTGLKKAVFTRSGIFDGKVSTDSLNLPELISAINLSADAITTNKLTTANSDVYGTIGTFDGEIISGLGETSLTGFLLKNDDNEDLYRIVTGNYGDDDAKATLIKSAGSMLLQATCDTIDSDLASEIELNGSEVSLKAKGLIEHDTTLFVENVDSNSCLILARDLLNLFTVDTNGNGHFAGNIYANGKLVVTED